mmetsp:Transcript_38723/g.96245  ORF Transcript_38723/g.96245 Transcript_38723/m.96245 type:complete len:440 (+) Transcript_38723:36-1355(+)
MWRSAVPLMLLSAAGTHAARETMSQIKERLLADYDKHLRPTLAIKQRELGLYGGPGGSCPTAGPVTVHHQFYIDYLAVDQKALDYTLEGFFRVWWTDERLKFNGTDDGGCIDSLVFGSSDDLWTPDLYFERSASITLEAPGNGEMLKVSPQGDVFWSRQSRVRLRCAMHFGNIPFDEQRCLYKLGIYSQFANEVALSWKPGAPALVGWETSSTAVWTVKVKDEDIESKLETYSTGNYTYATAVLTLERRAQGYVLSYMILAVVFVAMSYTGCFINPAATPGRVALAVITVLTVSGLQASAKNQLPPFAYNTWLTDFMFFSMVFNLVAFFEMAAVNYGMTVDAKCVKAEEAAKAKQGKQFSAPDGKAGEDGGDPDGESPAKLIGLSPFMGNRPKSQGACTKIIRQMKDLDYTMRWLFPLAYLVFCIVMFSQVGKYNPIIT